MTTFNELLNVSGVSPSGVLLLRHTGTKGSLGFSPYDLFLRKDGSFERYQSTQSAGKELFQRFRYWASFVGTPNGSTLFTGLYEAKLGDPAAINWLCPMTGLPPGQDKGHSADFFNLNLLATLAQHRGSLEIVWGGGYVAWIQRAVGNDKVLIGEVPEEFFEAYSQSEEGQELWRQQREFERNHGLVRKAFEANAETNGGIYICVSCGFTNGNRSLFDAHHPNPLANGPRMTRASELLILCPTCHRKAHSSGNRLRPKSIEELRDWVANGRL